MSDVPQILNKGIVLKQHGMDSFKKLENINYGENKSLLMDIYYPSDYNSESQLPFVIFVCGFSISASQKLFGLNFKELEQYTSWSKLITTLGYGAITYNCLNPESDFKKLTEFIKKNAKDFKINTERICLWSCSANTLLTSTILNSNNLTLFKCTIFYYGIFYHEEVKEDIYQISDYVGFSIPSNLNSDYSNFKNIPLLIVRAGLDRQLNTDSVELLFNKLIKLNKPIIFINYSSGNHAFDILDDNDESRNIIKTTLKFIKENI